MTTGSPIYLVSACGSAEDFVAAFRRYADRTGLFVPIAEPFAVGKRVWLALALSDGGVMIEGVAEVIQSSPKPSALHGRIGMTLRFLEPDAPSKTVLAELEKARLAMKPAAPTVAPRPASVPAEPRAVPPPTGGRIDAANALAESVAIGDLAGLRPEPPKAGQKFVMPTIPAMDRNKPPTAPPPERTKPATAPPQIRTAPGIGDSGVRTQKGTALGIAPLGRPRVTETQPAQVVPPPKNPQSGNTLIGVAAEVAIVPESIVIANKPQRDDPAPQLRAKSGTAPPRYVTPVAPLPIVRPPAHSPSAALAEDLAEKTDMVATPPVPEQGDVRAPFQVDTLDSGKAYVGPPPAPSEPTPATTPRSMRASEIIAAVPADDDWTMTPDAAAPTVLTTNDKPSDKPQALVIAATIAGKGPPTGDWTITNDPDAGWTEPAKVGARKPTPVPMPPRSAAMPGGQPSGNFVEPVSAEKALYALEDKPTSIGPKIEIDPSLLEAEDAAPAVPFTASRTVSGEMSIYPHAGPGVMAGATASPPPDAHASGAMPTQFPAPPPDAFNSGPMPIQFAPPNAFDSGAMPAQFPPHPADAFNSGAMPIQFPPPPPDAFNSGAMPIQFPPPPPDAFNSGAMPGPSPSAFAPPMAGGGYPMPLPPRLPPGGMLPGAPPAAPRMDPTDGGTGFFRDTNQVPAYPTDTSYAHEPGEGSNRRVLVIIGASLAAMLIVVVIALLVGGKKSPAASTAAKPQPATAVAPIQAVAPAPPPAGSGSAEVASGSGSAAVAIVQPAPVPEVAPGSGSASACTVEVTTVPPGADVALDDATVLGTTPGTFTLPCDAAVKLTIRKQRYANIVKDVTPTSDGIKLNVHLSRTSYSVKVTSTPAGATITVGGHVLGVTPTTIHLPAFETPAITITKDGYAPDTEKVSVKQNNLPYHVTLKKGVKKLH